jgi:hypothetical protein
MPRDRFIGDTPKDALEAFIDGWCREHERDSYSYAYKHKRITEDPEDKPNADAKFRFTRMETLYSSIYRKYEGYIYETHDSRYAVEHWDSHVDRNTPLPKPPGKTPRRLRGRRPHDTRY